ncbi:hypothetical protein N0V91_011414, partial [Didymella pomorum]
SEGYPTGPKPSSGSSIVYSSSKPAPYPTSSVKSYPASTPSSSKGYPASTPSSSAGYSASTPSSSMGYPASTPSAKASSSTPAGYVPYPVESSTKATPVPTGGYGSGYGY